MNWFAMVVHWLHVLLAVLWFGGHIVRVLLVDPAVRRLPEPSKSDMQSFIDRRATQIFVPAIVGVGVTGILRGTVFGPIQSLDALLGTPYGWTFLVGVALGLLAFYPSKPDWLLGVGLFGAFTAMILMHFGL
jgi:putative copper export protein